MEYTKQFNELIEKAASEKAFSLDVLKNINEMRDQFEALVVENKRLSETLTNCNGLLADKTAELNVAQSRLDGLLTKEKTLDEGLAKLSRDQFELDLKKSVADHGEKMAVSLFQTVFANTTLRKSVNRNIPGHSEANGNWVNEHNENQSEQISEE